MAGIVFYLLSVAFLIGADWLIENREKNHHGKHNFKK